MIDIEVPVTIPEARLEDLRRYVSGKGGRTTRRNVIQGKHGSIDPGAELPSLDEYLRLNVAAAHPGQQIPPTDWMPEEVRYELLQAAADSYDWIYEGKFDEIDLSHVLEILGPTLETKSYQQSEDAEALVQSLRKAAMLQDLPRWEHMPDSERFPVMEAVQMDPHWAQGYNPNSYVHDMLLNVLRRQERIRKAAPDDGSGPVTCFPTDRLSDNAGREPSA